MKEAEATHKFKWAAKVLGLGWGVMSALALQPGGPAAHGFPCTGFIQLFLLMGALGMHGTAGKGKEEEGRAG